MQKIADAAITLHEVLSLVEHAPTDQWMRLVTRAEIREVLLVALRTVIDQSIPSIPKQLTLEID